MKIITRAVWQMTPAGYQLLEQDAYEHSGPVAMAKGGGPAPVDPARQVAAESAANRPNVVGPGGTVTYSQGPQIVTGYDKNGAPILGNRDTETTALSPTGQRQFDTENQIAEALLGGASRQVGDLANTPFSFDEAGGRASKASFERQAALLRPQFERSDKDFEQRMSNAGIPLGSEAYNEAFRELKNNENFALTDAARASESQGADLAIKERQQRYNELAAALGGDQIMPFGGGSGAAPIDAAGAFGAAQDAKLARYNAGQQSRNTAIGAGAGLGAAAIVAF